MRVKRTGRLLFGSLAGIMLVASAMAGPAVSQGKTPRLSTNQEMLESLRAEPDFDIDDMPAVFGFVFGQLPDEVTVYPTENYYYFRFPHGGLDYAGNIRLAANDRDQGILHFAYFADATINGGEGEMHYRAMTAADDVKVEKTAPLAYRITHAGKSVLFRLNDLGGVRPAAGLLSASEDYLGPIQDESGLQFYLVYNRDLALFHYVLNEAAPVPDEFRPTDYSDRILIGHRSGYALYLDQQIERKILIGVHALNAEVNSYFDGPFDQLPDNFIKGDALKDAIEASDPSVAGRIDRYGYYPADEGRYLIGPYMHYSEATELVAFDLCATNSELPAEQYHACFTVQNATAE